MTQDADVNAADLAPPGADLQSRLARGYRAMVTRYRAGDVAGALAVRDQLRDELGWLITQASVDGQEHLAAGRPIEALGRFVEALELHRLNLADLELAVSVAATY